MGAGLRLETLLGEGGMSQVWRARTAAGNEVAVKFPKPSLSTTAGAGELVRREFRILHGLSHPHVVSELGLIDVGRGGPVLVTEYLGGGDLVPLAGAHPRHWVLAARDVARALAYIHEVGIVHRDVKARNVLLRHPRHAMLVDFALAAQPGATAPRGGGTVAYQSPEQRRGAASSVADDVHAFAALCYELLTGRLPFGANPSLEALQRRVSLAVMPETESDPAFRALADLIVEGLDPASECCPGSIHPFLDVLESVTAVRQ